MPRALSDSGSCSFSKGIRSLRSRRWRRRTGRQGSRMSRPARGNYPATIPASVRDIVVQPIEPPLDCDIVFSSLPSSVARETEEAFARAGLSGYQQFVELSNGRGRSAADRRDQSRTPRPDRNTACNIGGLQKASSSRIRIAPSLALLRRLRLCTESSASNRLSSRRCRRFRGPDIPGVASMDITDNVFPYIAGEEPKVETEAQKILGEFTDGVVSRRRTSRSRHSAFA